MSHRTLHFWRDTIKSFENGESLLDSFSMNSTKFFDENMSFQLKLFDTYKDSLFKRFQPKKTTTSRGVYFSLERNSKADPMETSTYSYQYKGYSIAKYKEMIVYSSPGFGIEGKPNTGKVSFLNENYEIIGQSSGEKFGHQIVFLDFNMDGFIDMAVSAPDFGVSPNNYYPMGAVYIFFGNSTQRFKNTPNVIIKGDFGDQNTFSNIGKSLCVGDINGDGFDDLIIGSPNESNGRGSVSVYYSRKNHSSVYKNVKDSSVSLMGSQLSWFGFKVKFYKRKQFPIILIGSPKFSQGNDSKGSLDAYEFINNRFVLKFSIQGSNKFDQTGMNFDIGKPFTKEQDILAISSPTEETFNPRSAQFENISINNNKDNQVQFHWLNGRDFLED
jgi:hypothetical protein